MPWRKPRSGSGEKGSTPRIVHTIGSIRGRRDRDERVAARGGVGGHDLEVLRRHRGDLVVEAGDHARHGDGGDAAGRGRGDLPVAHEVRRAQAGDGEHLPELVVLLPDESEVDERTAARRARALLRRRGGAEERYQVRLGAHVVDDRLDDAVREVPVADAADRVAAAEEEVGDVAGGHLLGGGRRHGAAHEDESDGQDGE
jgi:hypothetical protein